MWQNQIINQAELISKLHNLDLSLDSELDIFIQDSELTVDNFISSTKKLSEGVNRDKSLSDLMAYYQKFFTKLLTKLQLEYTTKQIKLFSIYFIMYSYHIKNDNEVEAIILSVINDTSDDSEDLLWFMRQSLKYNLLKYYSDSKLRYNDMVVMLADIKKDVEKYNSIYDAYIEV